MGVWKNGAFKMATELKATILPIALQGTAEGWERRKNSKTIQKAIVQILEPYDVAEHEEVDAKVLRSNLEKLIEQANQGSKN
jgi:1-acyl-sn-glycerol-3-phosphate acyltransferase